MKDLKKIQEFFSKSLKETTFKKGDKVTYLGHPGEITSVEDTYGKVYVSISYDKGNGKTKAKGILATSNDIKPLNEMEFGDPVDAVFRKYAGKTIEMDFEDMESDWANLLNDLEEYFPGDKLSDFMDSGEADLYLDDYNITLMEPIMDKEVDLDVLKRAKAKMDIDKMRYDAGMPPMDSIASLNENNLVMDDTITPDMWDREKIKVGIESKRINDPFWFTKPHTIIDFNSRMDMISFDHPAKPKRSLKWVNSFLKDNHKVDMSAEPEGYLSTKYAKSPSAKLKMNEDEDIDFEYRAVLDKFKDIMKGLDVKEADALQQKLKAYFAGLDENMKKPFTDYTNQELAAYVKNTKDKEAAKELHKRSQALKNLSRTDIEETDKDKLAKMRAANAGDDGNDKFFEAARLRALKAIQIQLQQMGVKYEMSGNPYKPFKVIYKPVNKDDRWYKDFDDIIFRYNLGGVVKTSMDEALMLDKYEVDFFQTKANVYANIEIPSENPTFEDDIQIKGTGKTEEEAFEDLKRNYENYKKTGIHEAKPTSEATKDEETEFHKKLDKLVHDTFGKRKGELEEVNLKQSKLSSAEYQKAKKLKDFKASDWKWNADKDLYTKVNEGELTEAYVPSNIKEFAKRRGVSRLVNTVAGWAEKVGARITGGTAIGYNYNTLILDMGYQTGDIRINVEDETIELYDEPIYSFADFKRVFMDEVTRNQIEHDEEQLRRERGLEEIKQRVFNKLKK